MASRLRSVSVDTIPPGVDPNAILEVPTWTAILLGYAGAHLVGFLFRIINQLLQHRYPGTSCDHCVKWEESKVDVTRLHGRIDELMLRDRKD